PHLTGRRFEHGVTDCYTLFRDAYHLAGIEMLLNRVDTSTAPDIEWPANPVRE
ncbi:tail fiber assembly protein, partial [Escherichia coli]|nr:tail fiber assembly protein [Escherichia coli]